MVFKWGAGFTFFQTCTDLLPFSHQSKTYLWSRKDLAGEVNNGFRLGANGFGNPNVEESESASLSCCYLCAKPQKLFLVVTVFQRQKWVASSFSEIQFLCTTSQLMLKFQLVSFYLYRNLQMFCTESLLICTEILVFGSDPTDVEFRLVSISFN